MFKPYLRLAELEEIQCMLAFTKMMKFRSKWDLKWPAIRFPNSLLKSLKRRIKLTFII